MFKVFIILLNFLIISISQNTYSVGIPNSTTKFFDTLAGWLGITCISATKNLEQKLLFTAENIFLEILEKSENKRMTTQYLCDILSDSDFLFDILFTDCRGCLENLSNLEHNKSRATCFLFCNQMQRRLYGNPIKYALLSLSMEKKHNILSKLEGQDECIICQERFDIDNLVAKNVVKFSCCGHHLHRHCFDLWFSQRPGNLRCFICSQNYNSAIVVSAVKLGIPRIILL